MIIDLFHTLLTQPLFNLLVFFYNKIAFGDFGAAIILLTILIRLILWPLSKKAIQAQRELQLLQPHIKEIQKKYSQDKEAQAKALMELYKEHKANPFGGCFPILVQLPILLALYSVFLNGLKPEYLQNLYSFISNPGVIDPSFLGLINLSSRSVLLAFLAGIFQFFQSKMVLPKINLPNAPKTSDEAVAQMVSKQMLYVLPVITVVISLGLPAGLALYWSATTIFTIFQQFVIIKPQNSRDAKRSSGKLTS